MTSIPVRMKPVRRRAERVLVGIAGVHESRFNDHWVALHHDTGVAELFISQRSEKPVATVPISVTAFIWEE